jgi:uncharacterized protein (TIGR00725 family)
LSWKSIAVIGGAAEDATIIELAYQVGQAVAKAGFALVCGGGAGVMEAACRGAKMEGGTTIGILPGSDPSESNRYLDVPLATGLGEARNTIVVRSATHGVIAVGGEFGTLAEIGFALKLGKPVVGLRTWELSKRGQASQAIMLAGSPEEAVRMLTG